MSEAARVNGPASPSGKYIDTIDPESQEYIRNLQRPAEVKEDMKQMEGRSRVSVVLNSQAFKEELEAIVQEQIRQGGPASLFALQQISDLLLPQSRGSYSSFGRSAPVIPVNDIRGVETLGYSKQEKVLRCKLAACYRLIDLFGWTHGIFNHISARLSQEQEQFLVNSFGMLYSEITASTLVKVDVRGEVLDTGSTGLGISKAGFTLHSAIHQARPDIRCIIHLHTPAAVAVSATKCGLLPISQEALIVGKVSYHDYQGILVDQEERDKLARNLGPFNKVMFLRNHGVVACGETIEEAFHYVFNIVAACEVQVKAMPVGLDNLVVVDEKTQEKTFKVGSQGGGGTDSSGRKWRCGELEWEALMRTLDNSGYRTGHVYKQPLMKQEKKERLNSDVEVPPASSSFTYVFDGDYEHSKYVSPIKLAMERQKQAYKAGWLTSPNTYKKQEIEEIGTTTPKKITKWVQDGETPEQRSTAIKVENPNQFAPQGGNPREFKDKQKSIRKDYYDEKVSAGPQSKILEGISWDEAAKTKESGDQTVIVGAASKGIIQRDHQHNAVVYRSYYAANPFENMTEDDVIAYKQQVEQQEHGGEIDDDVPGPEGRLISTEERMRNVQLSQEDVQQDTEENTTQETNIDSNVNGENESEQKRTLHPASPSKEPKALSAPADPIPLAPKLEELGLDHLVDTVVQAIMASAVPASLSKGQHSPRGDGKGVGSYFDFPVGNFPSAASSLSSSQEPSHTTLVKQAGTAEPDSGRRTSLEMAETTANVSTKGTESSETPEIMTVQLKPMKLFQGKPGDGVMRISFSIQSKVTRRRTKGPKSSWPIENVSIMQSQPKVMIVQSAEDHQLSQKKPKVLQEQQNINSDTAAEEVPCTKVPLSPSYQQKSMKRPHQSSARRQGAAKLAKPRKKFPRWSRRGLTHPLSPVKEEFLEGEDTLEALLARQNVDVDSDESLEDLLLMTDNYKENVIPAHKQNVSEMGTGDKTAPIATLEDLDESGNFTSGLVQEEQKEEFISTVQESLCSGPRVSENSSLRTCMGQSSSQNSVSSAELSPTEESPSSNQYSKQKHDIQISDKKSKDIEDELRYADEEVSNTFSEASDGDIAPRKQEEGLHKLDHAVSDPTIRTDPIPEEQVPEQKTENANDSCNNNLSALVRTEKEQKTPDPHGSAIAGADETEIISGTGRESEESVKPNKCTEPTAPVPDASVDSDMTGCAPLAQAVEDVSDVADPVSKEEKATSYRTDSASLETSPVVSSPPFDGFPSETVHRELHRVRSLESELDDPSSVKRRLKNGHEAVRRVQSEGPSSDNFMNKNRNVAVIDAVLHTVTIDPAKIAKSGQPVSVYLAGTSDENSSSDKRKRWTLMDSVSKSLENLDVENLAKEGSKIYGRSLEVLIHDGIAPEKSSEIPISPPAKASSVDDKPDDSKEVKMIQKGAKLYKDDVVVITKAPMDFSAISPQMRKDITEEEGPLVTSSPKLGRRKEGSFKKYQSKMGKSEETLLEVSPLSSERIHQAARRSKSFPKNYGLKKNRSKETLLDDQPALIRSDKEEEMKTSTQSMPVLDGSTHRNSGRRRRSRQARNSDPSSFSRSYFDYQVQAENEQERLRDSVMEGAPFEVSSDRRERSENIKEERADRRQDLEESQRYRGQLSQEPDKELSRRRRRRAHVEEKAEPLQSAEKEDMGTESDSARRNSSRRERRRRRQRDLPAASSLPDSGERYEHTTESMQEKDEPDAEKRTSQVDDGKQMHMVEERIQKDEDVKAHAKLAETVEVSPSVAFDRNSLEMEEFPPPPPPEDLFHEQIVDEKPASRPLKDTQQLNDFLVEQTEEENEENQPPRVRRPQQKEPSRQTLTETNVEDTDDINNKTVGGGNLQSKESMGDKSGRESTFLSTFKEPVQPVGDDFPSLSAKRRENSELQAHENEKIFRKQNTSKDEQADSEPEDTVPIAGNLDILDYGDEPPRHRSEHWNRKRSTEDRDTKTSRARQRAEQRRKKRSDDFQEEDSQKRKSEIDMSRPNSELGIRGHGDAGENLVQMESVDSLTSGELRGKRASRDNLSLKGSRASKDNLASRESLSLKEERVSSAAELDIIDFDSEPPRGRRDKQRPPLTSSKLEDDEEVEVIDKRRQEGRVRGRRSGHREGRHESDKPRRSRRQDDQNTQLTAPEIRVQAASRESLDSENLAPPLPPKQHRSMERLSEYSQRSRSRELLHDHDLQDVPPELPPKKNKTKTLSCVGGSEADTENQSRADRKEKKSKDNSSSKDRKKMPQPPPPPASRENYNEEPRRRKHQRESSHLQVPADDSFHRDSSFDDAFEKDKQERSSVKQRERYGGSPYYGDTEDEFDGPRDDYIKRSEKKSTENNMTLSPPQTPRPARKISTSSYGSVSNRGARSVSFDDGYTPTMSHPPQGYKSRESLASESSLHLPSYRVRSYSGASETSVSSNPLNYEPWRTKAAAQHQHSKSPSSRPRRSRSQGEPTYSANAGRRRRSRTPTAGDANRLYQPRRTRSRSSLPDAPTRSAAPSHHSKSRDSSMLADDSFSDAYSHGYASESMPPVPAPRSKSERQPRRSRELIRELEREEMGLSESERRPKGESDGDKLGSPDASGGETLEERSSKEGSPTKEAPSPAKDKKKKKKFRMPSFSKKKKESKESTI